LNLGLGIDKGVPCQSGLGSGSYIQHCCVYDPPLLLPINAADAVLFYTSPWRLELVAEFPPE